MNNKSNNPENNITRRKFLRSVYRWILTLLILPAGYSVYKLFDRPKFIPHNKRNVYYDPDKYRKEIPIQILPENSSTYTIIDGEKILLIRNNGNEILAYSAICTHKNCIVNFRKDMNDIFCDCHESTFGMDGNPVKGPAAEPLPRYKARIENGKIVVTFS